MKRALFLSVIFYLLSGGAPGLAGGVEKLAVLDVSRQKDSDWLDADSRLLEQLQARLSGHSQWQLLGQQEISAIFAEPAAPGWQELYRQARGLLQAGEQDYRRLRPRQAIARLTEALRILRSIFPFLPRLEEVKKAHLLLGATRHALGLEKLAARDYRMVLLLDPSFKPDETRYNPLVVKKVEQVRQRLLTEVRGSISFISRPPGALVLLDGHPAGRTPVTVPAVLPGNHYATLRLDGYRTWFGIIEVAAGANARQDVFLQEGQSFRWVRLRRRLTKAGLATASAADAAALARAMGTDWLLLVAIEHLGGRTVLEVAMAGAQPAKITMLGVFAATEKGLSRLSQRISSWMAGDRRPALVTTKPAPYAPPSPAPAAPVPPAGPAWYRSWWFWTVVGVVAAGAAATTTAALLSRQSGWSIEVVR